MKPLAAGTVAGRSPEVRAALQDQRGTDIEVGQTVAYNLSGTVAKGDVDGIGVILHPGDRWNPVTVAIRVRLAHPAGGHPAGHISTVRAAVNVLVLEDDLGAIARVLDRGIPDDRKLATITRLVHHTRGQL